MPDLQHLLEPLTAAEGIRAVAIIREVKRLAKTVRFVMVSLKEPLREAIAHFSPDFLFRSGNRSSGASLGFDRRDGRSLCRCE